jgi:hypothetical protein
MKVTKRHAEVDNVYCGNMQHLQNRGTWTQPAQDIDAACHQAATAESGELE